MLVDYLANSIVIGKGQYNREFLSANTNLDASNQIIVWESLDEEIVKATTEYSTHIHASVESGNVFACQFHPEKSSDVGLQILKNFVELS
mgnify:CR=1 FL=1